MKVYIVGTGMDGINSITKECEKAVNDADILIGAKRMLEPFLHLDKQFFCTYDTTETIRIIRNNPNSHIAVLMSGDCGFFSGARKLYDLIGDNAEIVCGISSPVYFCSKIGLNWDRMKFISLHGIEGNITVNVKMNELCFFLLGGKITPSEICERLCQYGLGNVKIYIGENLGYANEKITKASAFELVSYKAEKLCVLIAENPDYLRFIPSCISDGELIRGTVPMTKSEIRSLVVSKLNICGDDVCLDCGCGTGSISIEMAYRCPDGKVYGFDINPDAVELTLQNSRKFGCDNISATIGDSTEILMAESDIFPNKAFIGGTSGKIRDLISLLFERNPKIKLVITAVTLETLNDTLIVLDELGAVSIVSQISVVRTKKIGKHTMFDAQNPVFIIKGELRCGE